MIVNIDKTQVKHCKAIKHFRSKYKIIIDKINLGDYILKERNIKVAFKCITLYDLLNEINKQELFKEVIQLNKNFEFQFLLIEINKKKLKRKNVEIDRKEIYNIMTHLSLFTTILISPTKRKSFPLIEKYAKKCFNKNFKNNNNLKSNEKLIQSYLMTINGVSNIKARKICRKLKLQNTQDLLNLKTNDLVKVSGIGIVTAEKIIDSI